MLLAVLLTGCGEQADPERGHLRIDGEGLVDQEQRVAAEGGPVLGPLPEASYERGFVRMKPGDMIVAFSDGVVEATPPGVSGREHEFGGRRVLEVMRAHRGRPAAEVVKAIFARLAAWTAGEPAGDDRATLRDRPPVGQNICNRGQDLAIGDRVLGPGRRLRAADLSVLAAVGCEPVPVFRRPGSAS